MDKGTEQDRSFRAAQSQRAPHSAHRHRLRRRVHGPREHQLCRAADESRPALQRVELRPGRGAFLSELCRLRDPLEPFAVPVRRAPVDRANHDHLGPPGDGHDVREDAGGILRRAISAGHGRSGLLPRSGLLSQPVVSGQRARANRQPLLCGAAAQFCLHGRPCGRAAQSARTPGPRRLAMAVSGGGFAGRDSQRHLSRVSSEHAGRSEMAHRRGTGLAHRSAARGQFRDRRAPQRRRIARHTESASVATGNLPALHLHWLLCVLVFSADPHSTGHRPEQYERRVRDCDHGNPGCARPGAQRAALGPRG